jgi:hypothetical protein
LLSTDTQYGEKLFANCAAPMNCWRGESGKKQQRNSSDWLWGQNNVSFPKQGSSSCAPEKRELRMVKLKLV